MDINRVAEESQQVMNESKPLTISILINSQKCEFEVNATTKLIDIIREKLLLTGSKLSCGIGRCGACSVLMDGELVNSCLVMAYQANGKSIVSIEGISEDGIYNIQQAFLLEGGFQCGYCTSGMILAVKALLDTIPNPSVEEIKEGLAGNLCRCTGYGGIIRAVQRLIKEDACG